MSPEKQPEDTAGTPDPGDGTPAASGQEAPSAGGDAAGGGAETVTDAQAEADAAAEAAMAEFMSGQESTEEPMTTPPASPASGPAPTAPRQPDLRTVEFSQVSDQTEEGEAGSLEMLMDIRLPVSVELGRTQTFVRDILDYAPGTVVELDKLAGDPVDILVNGKLVAQGEVVVIDDHFGVRITVLLSPRDRVRSLGG
ncbi:MAG: flagellar motor switch protein FliN [Candidatus Eisenbacteria bacterium]